MAQSWAAMWHPVVGLWCLVKSIRVHRNRTPDLFHGPWTGRVGLIARPTGDSC
jgi:hypothetical protein